MTQRDVILEGDESASIRVLKCDGPDLENSLFLHAVTMLFSVFCDFRLHSLPVAQESDL